MSEILLAGYYGFNNLGDEAILEMFLKMLEKKTDKSNIKILTADPNKTKKNVGVDGINRYSFLKVNKAIFESKVVIVGGGSLLQDITSKRSIYYYLYIIFAAKLLNKKIALLSQGIGPIKGKVNRFFTSKILNKVDYISVRDNNSIEELKKIGVKRDDIVYAADPVIDYKINIKKTKSDKMNIGFSLRSWNSTDIVETIKKLMNKFEKDKFFFTFIPFHYDEDVKILDDIQEEFSNCMVIKERLSIKEIYEKIANLDIMVGVRLHSLIFATAAEIPVVGISYDPKVDSFLESIGESCVFNIEEIDENQLYDEINHKLKNRSLNNENIKKLKKSVNNNMVIINKLLN